MKIIYIGYQPLTKKIKKDFYFSEVREKGIDVEYWDLSNIYFSKIQKNTLWSNYIIIINNLQDLEVRISKQNIGDTTFVILITFEGRVLKLFTLLTRYNCRTAFFARGALPLNYHNNNSILHKLKKVFNPSILKRYLKNKYAVYLKKICFIKAYDVVFNAGEFGIQTVGHGYIFEILRSKIISINSHDYDNYIVSQSCPRIVKKKYCVFLDEYLPYHPDFKLFGIATVEPNEYYSILNDFLRRIETLYNIEVIIAAHPKAEGYKIENPFNGRLIVFDKTDELTRYSEFTIAHCSTSISFAVLNFKPIILLYSNKIKLIMPNSYNLILNFSKLLGTTLINMNSYSTQEIKLNVDQLKYTAYKYKYLCSKESEGKVTSDIFIDAIKKL